MPVGNGSIAGKADLEKPSEIPLKGNRPKKDVNDCSKLEAHLLSELRERRVSSTDDSFKYNYNAACDEGDGNYSFEFCSANILVICNAGGSFVENIAEGEECIFILDRTCFYAEQGGQIYDQGYITLKSKDEVKAKFDVQKVILQKGGYILHHGVSLKGFFQVGDTVALSFDTARRRLTMNNHTGAHILDHALLEILGSEYYVKGSLVTPERLQLDFFQKIAMTAEQIRKTESMVVDVIKRNVPVYIKNCKLDDAKKIIGLHHLPDVDYPDPVRVVSIGELIDALIENPQSEASLRTSIDFCGGTHVHRSGHIQGFVIASEEALSKGFRRIIALTGPGVNEALCKAETLLKETQTLADFISTQNDMRSVRRKWTEFVQIVSASVIPYSMKEEIKKKLNEMKKIVDDKDKKAKSAQSAIIVQQAENLLKEYNCSPFMVESLDADSNKDAVDAALKKVSCLKKDLSTMFFSVDENLEKIFAMCYVSLEAVKKGFLADKWIKSVCAIMNGKGGGNLKWAQASGTNFTKLKQAMVEARQVAMEHLGGGAEKSSMTNAIDFNAITSISDVYHVRNLIAEQSSSQPDRLSKVLLSCNGASYYFCDESFKGGCDVYLRAAVLQWINFADFTFWPCLIAESKLPKRDTGAREYNKCLEYLNRVLETETFLVYHKPSLADIAVFSCFLLLLPKINHETMEREYINVYRWFHNIYQHPCVRRYS